MTGDGSIESPSHYELNVYRGEEEYQKADEISRALFSGDIKNIPSNLISKVFAKVDHIDITEEQNIIDFLANNGICTSKREAREFVNAGSITVNGDK